MFFQMSYWIASLKLVLILIHADQNEAPCEPGFLASKPNFYSEENVTEWLIKGIYIDFVTYKYKKLILLQGGVYIRVNPRIACGIFEAESEKEMLVSGV